MGSNGCLFPMGRGELGLSAAFSGQQDSASLGKEPGCYGEWVAAECYEREVSPRSASASPMRKGQAPVLVTGQV